MKKTLFKYATPLITWFKNLFGAKPTPVPPIESKFKVVPPDGYLCFQFGSTIVVARNARDARRMMGRRFENHLKNVAKNQ